MRVLFWVSRIILAAWLLLGVFGVNTSYDNYQSDLTLSISAPQASQLSGEYILEAIGSLGILLSAGVFYIVFELMVISYYSRKRVISNNNNVARAPERSL